jgi:hypothetical protein
MRKKTWFDREDICNVYEQHWALAMSLSEAKGLYLKPCKLQVGTKDHNDHNLHRKIVYLELYAAILQSSASKLALEQLLYDPRITDCMVVWTSQELGRAHSLLLNPLPSQTRNLLRLL